MTLLEVGVADSHQFDQYRVGGPERLNSHVVADAGFAQRGGLERTDIRGAVTIAPEMVDRDARRHR